jgi:hypothetical protein
VTPEPAASHPDRSDHLGEIGLRDGLRRDHPNWSTEALQVGLAYLLFAPLPWGIGGMRQRPTLPPAFVRGLLHSIRHRLRDVLPILVFLDEGIVETWPSRVAAGWDGEFGVSPRLAVATAEPRFVEGHRFVYPDEAGLARRA